MDRLLLFYVFLLKYFIFQTFRMIQNSKKSNRVIKIADYKQIFI